MGLLLCPKGINLSCFSFAIFDCSMEIFENDFKTKNGFISKFRRNLMTLTDDLSNDVLFEYYKYILRSRHDYCHLVISFELFGKWVEERRIDDIFDEYNGLYGNLTPD